jgi:murein DD-endopeptidase MepM/ murein hydrolase activator NlpD
MAGHNGMDIPAILGEEVYHAATYDGWWHTEVDSAGGIGVDVVSNEPLFFPFPIPTELINTAVPYTQYGVAGFTHHVKMRYWHLYAPVGFNKKQVTCGTVVGQAGNTGASSGPHLHFAPKWCLPTGEGVASNNGYTGAFDPTPYYNHEVTAKDHALYMKQPVVPLSAVEQKDMIESLSVARGLLLALQKLVHTI